MSSKQLQAENEAWSMEMEAMHNHARTQTTCIVSDVVYFDGSFFMVPASRAKASLVRDGSPIVVGEMTDLRNLDQTRFKKCDYLVDVLAIADKLLPGTVLTGKRIKGRKSAPETKRPTARTDA
jgi:hypothetical protein